MRRFHSPRESGECREVGRVEGVCERVCLRKGGKCAYTSRRGRGGRDGGWARVGRACKEEVGLKNG